VLWGPTHALRVAWGIVLLGALLAAAVVALRRQTLAELSALRVTQAGPAVDAGGGNGGAARQEAAGTPSSPGPA
jgi:hypothetical protein